MDLSSERKEGSCWQINSKPRIACEELTKGNTHRKPRGKHRESEKGRNRDTPVASAATYPKREQNVPEVTKKLGVQPESGGWENRYGQCLFAALGFLYLNTRICMLVYRELNLLKNGSLRKSEFGGNLHSN